MNPHSNDYLIWHPFSQMKTVKNLPKITRAEGVWLHTENGDKIFDAISSWWVNLHGHSHPYIAEKVYEQMLRLEHVIFAGFTHDPAIELCKRLDLRLTAGCRKYFFSDNGSTAVEVALKLAIQYFRRHNPKEKINLVALDGAYHGDTFGAMSAGERSVFSEPWDDLLFDVYHLPPPVEGQEDRALEILKSLPDYPTVFIYEPLVQGAAGMVMHTSKALSPLLGEVKRRGGLLIADEVMTGFGRTGTFFASERCEVMPDLMCLSKGLTGGALPMALTICDQYLYDAFLDDRFEKGFLHGHSFTGNPVGCAAALASLDLFDQDGEANIKRISALFSSRIADLKACKGLLNVRQCGTILAADVRETGSGYIHPLRDAIYQFALDRGFLIRPLGNVIYLLPPYVSTSETLNSAVDQLIEIGERFGLQ